MLFGTDALAQTPFAALAYVEGSVSETITLTDVQTSQFAFVGDVAETMTLVDVQNGNVSFPVVVLENFIVTDVQTGNAG